MNLSSCLAKTRCKNMLYVLSWFMLNMLCALHVSVNYTFVLTGILAHYLRSCCRYTIRLASWLAGSYAGGWVWPRTATCCVNSAASFNKCLWIYIFKVCNNMYLALSVFKFTSLINVLWEQGKYVLSNKRELPGFRK